MIRSTLKRLAKRALGRAPRVPNAPATGRTPPTTRTDWQPEPEPEPEPPDEEPEDLEVDAATVAGWVEAGQDILLVDIREPHEVRQGMATGALWIPMNDVPSRLAELPTDRTLVVYCAAGARSYGVTHWLREQGYGETWSLVGGLGAWLETGAAWERPEL